MKTSIKLVGTLLTLFFLTGCGGGSSDKSSAGTTNPQKPTPLSIKIVDCPTATGFETKTTYKCRLEVKWNNGKTEKLLYNDKRVSWQVNGTSSLGLPDHLIEVKDHKIITKDKLGTIYLSYSLSGNLSSFYSTSQTVEIKYRTPKDALKLEESIDAELNYWGAPLVSFSGLKGKFTVKNPEKIGEVAQILNEGKVVHSLPSGIGQVEITGLALSESGRFLAFSHGVKAYPKLAKTYSVIDLASKKIIHTNPIGRFGGWYHEMFFSDEKLVVFWANDSFSLTTLQPTISRSGFDLNKRDIHDISFEGNSFIRYSHPNGIFSERNRTTGAEVNLAQAGMPSDYKLINLINYAPGKTLAFDGAKTIKYDSGWHDTSLGRVGRHGNKLYSTKPSAEYAGYNAIFEVDSTSLVESDSPIALYAKSHAPNNWGKEVLLSVHYVDNKTIILKYDDGKGRIRGYYKFARD